ncbi:MAG: hypothetical protein JWN04_3803 [Myxococcaceae bacterium]|nr:hypothetical protein [Myxococcaceae bacterium]
MRRRTKVLIAVAAFVLAVFAARLTAPIYILRYVNKTLEGLDGYTGHVADIDLNLWRGAYTIRGIKIEKTTKREPIPFVEVEKMDISVHWSALIHGSIVGEIMLDAPKLNFMAEKHKEPKAEDKVEKREAKKATRGDSSWQKQVKALVPLEINRIDVRRGELHYRDPYAEPKVNVYIQKLRGAVTNLTNSEKLSKSMVAHADFRGLALGSGELSLVGHADPYQKTPTFDLTAKLENLQMVQLNDFLKAYVNVDAEKGTLSVYSQLHSARGRFEGYVKPLIHDLKILRWKDEDEGFFHKLWEGVVEVGKDVLKNDKKEQVATKVPLSGKLEHPEAGIGATVLYVLKNAFIEALKHGLDPFEDGMKTASHDK